MPNFALCRGEGLKLCMSCLRHVDNHTKTDFQQFLKPSSSGEKCIDWKYSPPEQRKK